MVPPNDSAMFDAIRALFISGNRPVNEFYQKAWGRAWPTVYKMLYKPDGIKTPERDIQIHDDRDGEIDIFPRYDYVCFEDMHLIKNALLLPGVVSAQPSALVGLEGYDTLVHLLERRHAKGLNGFVVTGQPGIGKGTFLLYLLLYRLAKRQPTAIQHHARYYILFDHEGWAVRPTGQLDDRLQACWALTDSDLAGEQPCEVFRLLSPCVVQVTGPTPEIWKSWTKMKETTETLVMSLPTEAEIVAVVKEHNLASSECQISAMVRKWGPSLRLALDFARRLENASLADVEWAFERRAMNAARIVYGDTRPTQALSCTLSELCDDYAPFLFICPMAATKLQQWVYSMPTEHLRTLFVYAGATASKEQILRLSVALRAPQFARSLSDRKLEYRTHERLCSGSDVLHLFNGQRRREVHPAFELLFPKLPGDLDDPDHPIYADAFGPFYWIPIVHELEGVHGVLGDDSGNVYALHIDIKGEQADPMNGLSQLWDCAGDYLRERRAWNLVFVVHEGMEGNELPELYPGGLELNSGKHVDVWAAAI
ncbi:unnamed protein product [Peniophora sp. CBMAI 1063]|nr:unnamed protein product [Peniophora sp. CBMAI 1063]